MDSRCGGGGRTTLTANPGNDSGGGGSRKLSGGGGSSETGSEEVRGGGKRFARRAKRWAELQQRRQAGVGGSPSTVLPSATQFFETPVMNRVELSRLIDHQLQQPYLTVELACMGVIGAGQDRCSVLRTRRQEPAVRPLFCGGGELLRQHSAPLFVTRSVDDRGAPALISVYQTPSELTVFPYPPKTRLSIHPSDPHPPVAFAASSATDSSSASSCCSDLNQLCGDLVRTSLNSSPPLSTSPSSQSNDEDPFPELFTTASNSKRKLHYLQPQLSNDVRHSAPFHRPLNTAPPSDRNWVMIRHTDPDRPIATFTVLCYNVLCDKYATATLYSYCPSWALNWEYRKQAIIKEIRHYEADVITLQEVETEQYKLLFQPELKALGYASIFSPKSRAKTMNEEDRKYVDGCAIFWKKDKFEMEREHLIEFTQVAINKAQNSEHMLNRVMPKDNIALCAVLRIKDAVYNNRRGTLQANENVVGTPLVVCTAHIHWDPEYCDVKLVQTMMLVQELAKLLDEVSTQFRLAPTQIPVLVCGDLNSLPDSGVYEFLSKGAISRQHPDLKGFRDDTCLNKFSATDDPRVLTHSLRLDSAVETSTVPFTNYTLDFKGMIDYIFSTPQSLAKLGVLGPLEQSWLQQNKIIGFPHPHVPSDHIPIMAQYAVIPTSHQRQLAPVQHFGNSHSSGYGAVGR